MANRSPRFPFTVWTVASCNCVAQRISNVIEFQIGLVHGNFLRMPQVRKLCRMLPIDRHKLNGPCSSRHRKSVREWNRPANKQSATDCASARLVISAAAPSAVYSAPAGNFNESPVFVKCPSNCHSSIWPAVFASASIDGVISVEMTVCPLA